MSLKIKWIAAFNPFDFISCPLCGKTEFISLSCGSVWCDYCNTNFSVRHTSGDPGCVVDAFAKDAYAPTFKCPSCSLQKGSLEQSLDCPHCQTAMEAVPGYSMALLPEKELAWYWILKIGDYSSGWLRSTRETLDERYEHPTCKDKEMDAKWAKFQDSVFSQKKGKSEINGIVV